MFTEMARFKGKMEYEKVWNEVVCTFGEPLFTTEEEFNQMVKEGFIEEDGDEVIVYFDLY